MGRPGVRWRRLVSGTNDGPKGCGPLWSCHRYFFPFIHDRLDGLNSEICPTFPGCPRLSHDPTRQAENVCVCVRVERVPGKCNFRLLRVPRDRGSKVITHETPAQRDDPVHPVLGPRLGHWTIVTTVEVNVAPQRVDCGPRVSWVGGLSNHCRRFQVLGPPRVSSTPTVAYHLNVSA